MRKRTEIFIYLGLISLSVLSLAVFGLYSDNKIDKTIRYHGNALTPQVWEMDYQGIEQYLSLAINSYGYKRVVFNDTVYGNNMVDIQGLPPGIIDNLLISLGLLRTTRKTVNIYYEKVHLGTLVVFSYNRYVYQQFYLLLIFILMVCISYLILHLNRARSTLEQRVLQRTVEMEKHITNRMRMEENLKLTLDSIGDGVISTDREGRIIRMNPVAQQLTGYSMEEAAGQIIEDILHIQDHDTLVMKNDSFREIIENGSLNVDNSHFRTLIAKTGEEFQIIESGKPIQSNNGKILGVVLVFRDMTRELKMQNQLEHSQRMDAVGQLASGIAHDFNNMLGGILGSSELLDSFIQGNEKAEKMNHIIHEAAERAAELTNQLLTFSRKKPVVKKNVDLHEIISETAALLERTIDKRIKITLDLQADVPYLSGDPSMLQNAIINMGINASHAIPEEGNLFLCTRNKNIDDKDCQNSAFDLDPGMYIELIVEDDGVGMTEEIQKHIFEPFFTTKMHQKGTGLGLATVFGIMKQHKGEIKVYSEVGHGTAFHLFFPVVLHMHKSEKNETVGGLDASGTVLVVDDLDLMRTTASEILKDAGFRVLVAEDGYDALQVFNRENNKVDLILLDMIMPRMNGKEFFIELQKISPETPIILSSGFKNSKDFEFLNNNGLQGTINKPYRRNELLDIVSSVIDKHKKSP